NLNQQ
ncbi:tRNA-specific 2-thiouridylase MnmA, partial [Haemophilus influenzae]